MNHCAQSLCSVTWFRIACGCLNHGARGRVWKAEGGSSIYHVLMSRNLFLVKVQIIVFHIPHQTAVKLMYDCDEPEDVVQILSCRFKQQVDGKRHSAQRLVS